MRKIAFDVFLDKHSLSSFHYFGVCLQRELRQSDDLAAFESRFMGADTDTSPIGTRHCVGLGIAVLDERADKLVDQVRMRTAMSASLKKRQVVRVMNLLGQRELANRLG